MRTLLLTLLFVPITAHFGSAATLQCELGTAAAAQSGVGLPIWLAAAPGEEVAGIQFDIEYNGEAFSLPEITLGQGAADAGKDLNLQALGEGRLRVLIVGLNRNVVPDGILVTPSFDVNEDTAPGFYSVLITNALMSDPDGFPVESFAEHGAMQVAEAEGEGEGEPVVGCGSRTAEAGSSTFASDTTLVLALLLTLIACRLDVRKARASEQDAHD